VAQRQQRPDLRQARRMRRVLMFAQRSFDAVNVASAFGSGIRSRACGSPNDGKCANSARRPCVTAAARSPSKSQKKLNGVDASNSSPMKSIGTCGASRRQA